MNGGRREGGIPPKSRLVSAPVSSFLLVALVSLASESPEHAKATPARAGPAHLRSTRANRFETRCLPHLRGGGTPGTASSAVCCQHNATVNGDVLPIRYVLKLAIPQICSECVRRTFGAVPDCASDPKGRANAGLQQHVLDAGESCHMRQHAGARQKQAIFVPEPAPEFSTFVSSLSQTADGHRLISGVSEESDACESSAAPGHQGVDLNKMTTETDSGEALTARRRLLLRNRALAHALARQRYTCTLIRNIDALMGIDTLAQNSELQCQFKTDPAIPEQPVGAEHGCSTEIAGGRELGHVLSQIVTVLKTKIWRAEGQQRQLEVERGSAVRQVRDALAKRTQTFCQSHAAWAQDTSRDAARQAGTRDVRSLNRLGEAWESACARDEGWGERLSRAALLLVRADGSVESGGTMQHGSEEDGQDKEDEAARDVPTSFMPHTGCTWLDKVVRAGLLASMCRARQLRCRVVACLHPASPRPLARHASDERASMRAGPSLRGARASAGVGLKLVSASLLSSPEDGAVAAAEVAAAEDAEAVAPRGEHMLETSTSSWKEAETEAGGLLFSDVWNEVWDSARKAWVPWQWAANQPAPPIPPPPARVLCSASWRLERDVPAAAQEGRVMAHAHVVAAEGGCLTDVTRRYVSRWSDVTPHRARHQHHSLDNLLFLLSRDRRGDGDGHGGEEGAQDDAAREEAREFWQVSPPPRPRHPAAAAALSVPAWHGLQQSLTRLLVPACSWG